MFASRIFVTRDGDSFRVVPASEANQTEPVWAVGRRMTVETQLVFTRVLPVVPDIYHQHSKFAYFLAGVAHGDHWQISRTDPEHLSRRDIRRLQPVVTNELNARFQEEKLGDQLAELLAHGTEAKTSFSRQNWITGIALASMVLALGAMISMFIPKRKPVPQPETIAAPEIAIVS